MDFREIKEFIKDFSGYILVAVISILIVVYIIGFEQIIGPSMNPNLKEDDIVLLDKIVYKMTSLSRFDVIVLKQDEKHMVKRVIGLPGDYIEYKDNILYVNGSSVEEDFLKDIITDNFKLDELEGNYLVIPDDMYLVLGDNRENSLDSRLYGLINENQIVGRVIFRLLPITKISIVK